MKGSNLASLKLRAKAAEEAKVKATEDEVIMEALIAEETSRYRNAALVAAEKRFTELEPEAQAKLTVLIEEEGELKVKKDFLEAITVKIEKRTNEQDFDQDIDPDDLANEIVDDVESIEEMLTTIDTNISDAEEALSELESDDS